MAIFSAYWVMLQANIDNARIANLPPNDYKTSVEKANEQTQRANAVRDVSSPNQSSSIDQ